MTELKVDATLENLERVLSFVEERLETCSCSMKTIMQIQIAVEEIYVNIASYAYKEKKGEAIIKIETDQEVPQVSLTFEDYGDPYNPLLKEDPDITLSAEERKIGGLGIYLVKKSMDKEETMEIKKMQDGDNLTIVLTGRLDTTTAPHLEAELKSSIGGVTYLIFDFENLEYISSAGLRVILSAQKVMNRQGNMVIRNVDENVMDVFEVTGFVDILTIE